MAIRNKTFIQMKRKYFLLKWIYKVVKWFFLTIMNFILIISYSFLVLTFYFFNYLQLYSIKVPSDEKRFISLWPFPTNNLGWNIIKVSIWKFLSKSIKNFYIQIPYFVLSLSVLFIDFCKKADGDGAKIQKKKPDRGEYSLSNICQ